METRSSHRNALISYGLLLAVFAGFMALYFQSLYIDPPGSYLDEGPAKGYGRNGKIVFQWGIFMVAEFLLLLGILAPHKGHRHWGLVLSGFIAAALWTMMWLFGIMHASPVFGIHLYWMIVVCIILLFALILGFFDRHYNLPTQGSLRILFYRGLVILFSALLAGILTLVILVGGFSLVAMLVSRP